MSRAAARDNVDGVCFKSYYVFLKIINQIEDVRVQTIKIFTTILINVNQKLYIYILLFCVF